MWPFNKNQRDRGSDIQLLGDAELIEQASRVRSLARRELHFSWRSRKMLLGLITVSMGINGGLTYALAEITPTIRLVPMMVTIRADGTPKAEPLMSMMEPGVQEAVLRSTLWQYVLWREGYSFDTAKFRATIVTALSGRDVGGAYLEWYNYPNPDSPQVRYGKKGVVSIDQDAGDFEEADPNVYRVEYWRTVTIPGQPSTRSHWRAFVHYEQVTKIPYAEHTTINPAMIKVIGYAPPSEIDAPPTSQPKGDGP